MDRDHAAVALLPAETARRIAAGEVIEKPASVVRELIDNSLDADAGEVDITWEAGGSELIRVRDDGTGMTREDLELCWKPHATSKIRTLEDLDHARSLGFRGEALASVAAVSELTIESTRTGAEQGHRLDVRRSELQRLIPAPPRPGTSVTVQRLFANLPARRRFLSRPQAETRAIRNTVLEKTLPFPTVRFTLPGTGNSTRVLSPQSLVERVAEVYGNACPAQSLTEISGSGEGFHCTIVAAHPEVIRRDRRLISVYVNKRRVSEYKLVQAVEYAYQDVQHGGVFPAAALLVDVDPELADFNIHPAKREVRLRNMGEIHHRVVELLRAHLRTYAIRAARWQQNDAMHGEPGLWPGPAESGPTAGFGSRSRTGRSSQRESGSPAGGGAVGPVGGDAAGPAAGRTPFEHDRRAVPDGFAAAESTTASTDEAATSSTTPAGEPIPDDTPRRPDPEGSLAFHGTAFGTYNLVEQADRLYLLDQHAAHERLLYERLRSDRVPQVLLVPEEFDTTPDQDRMLRDHRDAYHRLGVVLEPLDGNRWRLTAIPGEYHHRTDVLIETILELGGLQDGFDRTFLAEIACKAAIKAGEYLDSITGEELVRRVFALPEPRCPHGRPLWVELSRDDLDRMIGRR